MPRDHAGHEEGAEVDHCFDIGPHHGEFGAAGGPRHGSHRGEPGVVDEDVDGEAALFDQSGQFTARVGVGQVSRNHLGADVMRAGQFVGEGFEAVFAPGHQRDAVSPTGELSCDFGADARRRPCDQSRRVVLWGGECHVGSVLEEGGRDICPSGVHLVTEG